MCAICGIVNFNRAENVDGALIRRMTGSLAHRGPDGEGYFVEGPIGLGHRRLSIIDLAGGGQPIFNEDSSAVIVFNGEVYNYRDLTVRLIAAGHAFRTRSDTEAILHAYDEYGDDCVDRLRGMFAFAIWDRPRKRLLLARDRLGVKPLYYYAGAGFLAFASEIKALLEIPAVPREVDPEALDLYLSLRYVPGPRTMFRNILRLQPGHVLAVDARGVRIRKYWDIEHPDPEPRPDAEVLEAFQQLLEESVRLRLVADVPLGLFLSGGLDSSAILCAMSKARNGDGVKTFSVGYRAADAQEQESNEFEYARLAAGAFRAEHHEFSLSPAQFEDFLPRLVWHLDEPLADSSCIPLYFISRLAREHVTVILSGEGADEILAGYGIYRRMIALDRVYESSTAARRLAPWVARLAPWEPVRHYIRLCGLPQHARYRGVSRGVRPDTLQSLVGDDRAARSADRLQQIFGGYFKSAERALPLNRLLYVDAKIWLPDDLLIKADKMTMANGLELRVPFLDHKLVEFAAALPPYYKLNGQGGKALLRQAMRGVLPDAILDRPKKGFPTPIAPWLRSGLRRLTREALLGSDSAARSYLDPAAVARIVSDHEQGRADRSGELWTLLIFEFWHRVFIDKRLEHGVAPSAPEARAVA